MSLESLCQYRRIYLASPYRLYRDGLERAWIDVCALEGKMRKAGLFVYSPIAHCHGVAIHGGIDPNDDPFWVDHIRREQNLCDCLAIGQFEGWHESDGIKGEFAHAHLMHPTQPVYYIDPLSLFVSRGGHA